MAADIALSGNAAAKVDKGSENRDGKEEHNRKQALHEAFPQ